MRLVAPLVSLAVLGAGVFYVYRYFASRYILTTSDPTYAVTSVQQILELLLIAGVIATLLFALLLYSLLSRKVVARRIAYHMSKDISFSKEQFRRFYELSPVPYLLISPKGKIIRPNKATLRFFGLGEDELIGQDIFSFMTIEAKPEKMALYKERVARHMPIEQKEVQVRLQNGELHWTLLSVGDLTAPGTLKHQGLVTLVDIHEQKELERIKTEFLSLASHQLRSPLANLKWYIDFLLNRRRDQLTDETQSYLHKMYHRNEDMIDLVNTLLSLSRIEMGRVKVQCEKVDMAKVAESVVEELEPSAREKEIELQTTYADNLIFNTDGRLLRIILQNLLSNAIRYTNSKGKVSLRIYTTGAMAARIEVVDTGVGIPTEEQGRIFSKLYRATNAKEMEANGNGIGLYMCKALAESLGGTISFQSVPDTGTTFVVELPQVK